MTELNDELLVAYADGQLGRDQSRAIERVLANDEFAAERVAELRLANVRMEAAFDAMLRSEQAEMGIGKAQPPPRSEAAEPEGAREADRAAPVRAANTNSAFALRPPRRIAAMLSEATRALTDRTDMVKRRVAGLKSASEFRIGSLRARAERHAETRAFNATIAVESFTNAVLAWPGEQFARLMDVMQRRSVLMGAAAAIVSFVVVGTIAVFVMEQLYPQEPGAADPMTTAALPTGDWREEAARAQSLYGRETFEVGLDSQSNLDLVSFQLSKMLGSDIVVPDLRGQGLSFQRAQLLRFKGRPVAQLAYLAGEGAPLILYISAEGGEALPDFRQIGPLGSASWTEHGFSYLIVGPGGRRQMLSLIDAVRGAKPAGAE